MSGFQYGGDAPGYYATPLGAIASAIGILPSFHAQGNVALDTVTQTALIPSGGSLVNQGTNRLIEDDPPLAMATNVYTFPTGGVASMNTIAAWNTTVNDIGTQSELIAVTYRATTLPALLNVVGKRSASAPSAPNVGYELSLTTDQKVNFVVEFNGFASTSIQLVGPFVENFWHTVVAIVDRSTGELVLGATHQGASEAANEMRAALPIGLQPADTASNAVTYSIGKNRLNAFHGAAPGGVLHVTHARGPGIEGKSAKLIARRIARLSWWDAAYTEII